MNSNMIHETVIRDIIDVIYDVKDSDELKGLTGRNNSFKSVASAASNLTLVFPVITSRNLSIDNAAMITKAIERKAVSLLQLLFNSLSISAVDNGIEYVKKFHTNLKFDGDLTVDGFISALDKYVVSRESAILDREMYENAKRDLRNINTVLGESISESTLLDYKIYPQAYFGESCIINEADIKRAKAVRGTTTTKNINKTNKNYSYSISHNISSRERNEMEDMKDSTQIMKNRVDIIKNQLLDTDVKKSNELVPTMMIVNFVSTASDTPVEQQMVVGIKAKMYPVDSVDILNRIQNKNKDNNGFLKFIRATTREISFCRDFMFAIEKAKLDALSQSKKGSSSKLWKILERRSFKSKIRRHLGQINDASAITTLVVSQEEVEYLKKTESIDIENPKVIRPIMESYNLMGMCIVDESVEVSKFLFDTGDDIYENLSFSHLERENSNGMDRKVINLMTKMAR